MFDMFVAMLNFNIIMFRMFTVTEFDQYVCCDVQFKHHHVWYVRYEVQNDLFLVAFCIKLYATNSCELSTGGKFKVQNVYFYPSELQFLNISFKSALISYPNANVK